MTLHVYIHSRSKRVKTVTLLDSGATENFINISYAQKLNLPIRRLTQERRLFNVNGTLNKAGTLKYYTNIITRTGTKCMHLRYFLTDLEDNQVILGYLSWTKSATSSSPNSKSKVPQVSPLIRPACDPEKQGAHAKPSGDRAPHDQTRSKLPDKAHDQTHDKSQDPICFGQARSLLIDKWKTMGTVFNQRRHMILVKV